MLVYIIRNLINGKAYIGQHTGTRLDYRWREHLWHAKNNSKYPLHNAIRKYGVSQFEVLALSTFANSQRDLDDQEIHYIARYRTNESKYGYNLNVGGKGNAGFKHREETKKKIGDANRGVTRNMGHKVSQETRFRISAAHKRLKIAGLKRKCKPRGPWTATRKDLHKQRLNKPETRDKLKTAAISREAKKRSLNLGRSGRYKT